ncbi:MAG: TolC family protein [Nannocystaceae bacterium]|nr:TolC family protein [bacterium]
MLRASSLCVLLGAGLLSPVVDAAPPPVAAPSAPEDTPTPRRASAFDAVADGRLDPYGRRPADVSRLGLDQIVRYALENPAVKSADEQVTAMRAQLRKAQFAWVPVIETSATLSPGVNIRCDDVNLDDGSGDGFDFQYCRSRDDNSFDVNTIDGYFAQLADAGVRFEFRADMVIPITTFGKIRNTRKLAEVGVALKELEKGQVEQETVLRVQQAYAALLLARDTVGILREAKGIVDKAQRRIEAEVGGGDDDWDADPSEGDSLRDPDDLIKVKLAAIELEQLMRQALNVESYALSALWALAGDAAPPGFDVKASKLRPMAIEGGLQRPADYKQMAVARRPEARMASAAVKAREFQEKLARSNFLPDLGIAVQTGIARSNAVDQDMSQLYYQDGFNWTRFSAALAMRWRWDFHFKTFDLQTARANTRAAMRQEEAAALLLGLDVQQAYGDLVEAKHLVDTYDEAVDLSWRLVVSGQQKDSVGGGNATELLRNLEKWYKRRFDYAQAIFSYNDALARLSRAVGTQLGRETGPTAP